MSVSRFEVAVGNFAALGPGGDTGLPREAFKGFSSVGFMAAFPPAVVGEEGDGGTRRLGAAATSLKSPTRPSREAAWTAHPRAMASSGFTVRRGVTPVDAFTSRPMNGMRTAPPTSTTLFNRWAYRRGE